MAPERLQERLGRRLEHDEQHRPDRERRPQCLRRQPGGALLLARSRRACDHRRRPVREEVEDREGPREHGAGEPEGCDLRTAEMADDGRVGKDVERFGREGAERRERQPQDLAVVRRAQPLQRAHGRRR